MTKLKLLTDIEKAALQKEAQTLLAEADKLLLKAGKLAEKGMFDLSFMGHDYYPESLYVDVGNLEGDAKYHALGLLPLDQASDGLDDKQLDKLERQSEEILDHDDMQQEAEYGCWYQWVSSNC